MRKLTQAQIIAERIRIEEDHCLPPVTFIEDGKLKGRMLTPEELIGILKSVTNQELRHLHGYIRDLFPDCPERVEEGIKRFLPLHPE